MSEVDAGLAAQIKNIEVHYRKPMSGWMKIVKDSGFSTHAQIVAMLQQRHGIVPGAADRISQIALAAQSADGGSRPRKA